MPPPAGVVRSHRQVARELGLTDMTRDADAWLRVVVEHPSLIQRPLVLTDDGRAWVARDDETLAEIVGNAD